MEDIEQKKELLPHSNVDSDSQYKKSQMTFKKFSSKVNWFVFFLISCFTLGSFV